MKITTTGVGGAWAPAGVWNTSAVVHGVDGNLLTDCGGDIRHALAESKVSSDSIGAIWITHLHGDHIDGLEFFAFERYCMRKPRPVLFVHAKHRHGLWAALEPKIGLFENYQRKVLDDYFDVRVINDDTPSTFNEFTLNPVTLEHINEFNDAKFGNSIGLTVTCGSTKALFAWDTRAVDFTSKDFQTCKVINAYKSADIVFQDCATFDGLVHASIKSLSGYPENIRNKMVLTHCTQQLGDIVEANGFIAQASVGRSFNIGE